MQFGSRRKLGTLAVTQLRGVCLRNAQVLLLVLVHLVLDGKQSQEIERTPDAGHVQKAAFFTLYPVIVVTLSGIFSMILSTSLVSLAGPRLSPESVKPIIVTFLV